MKYLFALFVLLGTVELSAQNDKQDIKSLLGEFLSNVESREMHERFWADELVYTSSSGARFGKNEIMYGFDDDPKDQTPGPKYYAEEVEVMVYGNIATLVFKLIAENPDDSQLRYYNSGTFQKQKGNWKAIIWQATKIPGE